MLSPRKWIRTLRRVVGFTIPMNLVLSSTVTVVVAACHPSSAAVAPPPSRAPAALPPLRDTDGDGQVDASDRCPLAAEDRDGIEDDDGCPEIDADEDRILDEEDACPTEPGGVLARERGCPFVLPAGEDCTDVSVAPEVHFAKDSAELERADRELVAIIARDVAALPDAYTLIVVGHRTRDESIDRGLDRAQTVRDLLGEAGLSVEHLLLVNRADSDTTEDADSNRRVTFHVQGPCSSPRPPEYAFQEPVPPPLLPADAPAMRYANLAPGVCRAELQRRKLPVQRDGRPTPGVATGVRFTGPIHGITILAPGRPTTFGVMDCRLALDLDDAAEVLATHGVVRVQIDNTYRRGANLPIRGHGRSQHAHGLAADITTLYLADGRRLQVERDWNGKLGDVACGPEATLEEPTENAIALRDIACDLGRHGLFHTMLTPGFNAAHHNHFHFDIKRDAKRWNIH